MGTGVHRLRCHPLDSGAALFRVSGSCFEASDFGHVVTRVRVAVEISALRSEPVNECKRLCLLKKSGFTARFLSLLACWLVASLVSPDQVHAVAICGVGLPLRNRTSRFRFCTVAAR